MYSCSSFSAMLMSPLFCTALPRHLTVLACGFFCSLVCVRTPVLYPASLRIFDSSLYCYASSCTLVLLCFFGYTCTVMLLRVHLIFTAASCLQHLVNKLRPPSLSSPSLCRPSCYMGTDNHLQLSVIPPSSVSTYCTGTVNSSSRFYRWRCHYPGTGGTAHCSPLIALTVHRPSAYSACVILPSLVVSLLILVHSLYFLSISVHRSYMW